METPPLHRAQGLPDAISCSQPSADTHTQEKNATARLRPQPSPGSPSTEGGRSHPERDEFRRPRGQRQADLQTRPSGWPGTLGGNPHSPVEKRKEEGTGGKIILRSCFNLTLCAIKNDRKGSLKEAMKNTAVTQPSPLPPGSPRTSPCTAS